MKKISLLLSVLSVVFVLSLTMCQKDEDCKICKSVTSDASGNIIEEDASAEYCGDELAEIESEAPFVNDSLTTKWVCE